jgi:hypothetical protein
MRDDLALISAIEEADADEAEGGINGLWWAIAAIAGTMFRIAICGRRRLTLRTLSCPGR